MHVVKTAGNAKPGEASEEEWKIYNRAHRVVSAIPELEIAESSLAVGNASIVRILRDFDGKGGILRYNGTIYGIRTGRRFVDKSDYQSLFSHLGVNISILMRQCIILCSSGQHP